MLKVQCLVFSFFQLVLGVPLKLVPNFIDKNPGILKNFMEKDIEVGLYNQSGALISIFELNPLDANGAIEKKGCKSNTIHFCSL